MKKLVLILFCAIGAFTAGAQTEATWYTSMGSFKTVLTDTLTPITVDSFIARVSEKFYDGTIFHRVIDNFMIQGGDPTGTGSGGPGYTIPDEFDPSLKNIPAALSMANTGTPNTGGCQFFINLVVNSHLDNLHTVFGKTTVNFSVVQSIGHVATNASDKPLVDVRLDSIRITHLATGIRAIGSGVVASVFPNPCRGQVTISLPDINTKVALVNMLGQVVYTRWAKGSHHADLTNLPTGLYILHLSNEKGTAEMRVVVQ